MSIQRLDIKALVALVDEDELRKELDKNVYYYWLNNSYLSDNKSNNNYAIKRFKPIHNPIEYLIFNDEAFVRLLFKVNKLLYQDVLSAIVDSYKKNKNDKQITYYINELGKYELKKVDVVRKATNNLNIAPTKYSEIIWDLLNKMRAVYILQYFCIDDGNDDDDERVVIIHLLDNNFNHILPVNNYNYDYCYQYET